MKAVNKKVTIKKKVQTEPLAVGFEKGKLILLFKKTTFGKSTTSELRITSGTKETSFNGLSSKVKIINEKNVEEKISYCSSFRFSELDGKIVLTYVRETEKGSVLIYSTSKNKKLWKALHVISQIRTAGVVVGSKGTKSKTNVNIFFGDQVLKIAKEKNTKSKTTFEIISPPRVPHWQFFEGVPFSVFGGLNFEKYVIVFYSAIHTVDIMKDVNLSNQKIGEEKLLKIGFALFSQEEPTRLLWQSELPVIEVPIDTHGNVSVLGVVHSESKDKKKKSSDSINSFRIYTTSDNGEMGYIDIPHSYIIDNKNRKQTLLKKWHGNPILSPTHHEWERDAAFNPTALHLGGKVHLLYRAIGPDGMSRIGYASSKDGLNIDERLNYPIYTPQAWFETNDSDSDSQVPSPMFSSGGGWGGCEDPKITQIGDRVYMTYVAFTGSWPTRTVLTSISVDDFLKKRWRWSKPMLMSPPGVGSKSVALFPERINDKFYIFHRVWPNIMIDAVDNLEFGEGKKYLTGQHMIRPRKSFWDSQKLSVGASPIKTSDGWLTIYNAVDRFDSGKYKIGAMLLDLKDPVKVLARSRKPILSPEEYYENDGKPGVAYPGGVANLDDMLHVYYGGGDKVSAVAQVPIDELVSSLKKDRQPHIKITKI